MAQMIRKQIYIGKRQEALLKRLAKARQVSEAEIIRQALDREAAAPVSRHLPGNRQVLDALLKSARARRQFKQPDVAPYRWKREDAYEDREARFDKFSHPEAGQ